LRVVVCANSFLALPALDALARKKRLAGLVLPAISHAGNRELAAFANESGLPHVTVDKTELERSLGAWLDKVEPDALLVMTFPYRLPDSLLSRSEKGCYNFHFGRLPGYRGPDPIFWEIRNGERSGGIYVHRMEAELDTGPLLTSEDVAIVPGETYGIHMGKLSLLTVPLAERVLDLLAGDEAPLTAQDEKQARYYRRPTASDLTIDWKPQSADEIENLVNAANPTYQGAMTLFRDSEVRIFEVSPADLATKPIASPGTIVFADPQQGLFVLCRDYRFLRINVLQTSAGWLTGFKMVALGIRAGERFEIR
jgi:methionyl-tRNA formyltransferase